MSDGTSSASEPGPVSTPSPGRRLRPRYPNAMGLLGFVVMAVGCGGAACLAGFMSLARSLTGEPVTTPGQPVWFPVLAVLLGGISVAGGLAMWRRHLWGWWVMLGVLCAMMTALGGVPALQLLVSIYWLSSLRPLFADPYLLLEADIDRIAGTVGINWHETPLACISEALATGQRGEATRLYREHFQCTWDDAYAGIARWQTDTAASKLRYIADTLKSHATAAGTGAS